jgi:hypothetical protein
MLLHFAETNGSWQSSPFVFLLMLLHFAETNESWHAGPKHHRVATNHDNVEICAGFLWSLTCRTNQGNTGNAQQQGYQVHSWTNNSSSSVVRLFAVTELPCAQDSNSLPQSSFGVLACIPSINHFRKDGELLREFHTHKSWGEPQQQCIRFQKLFIKTSRRLGIGSQCSQHLQCLPNKLQILQLWKNMSFDSIDNGNIGVLEFCL